MSLDNNPSKKWNEKVYKNEIDRLKRELIIQLNLREKELKEFYDLKKSNGQLEKRYDALKSSFFGKITLRYWSARKKFHRVWLKVKGNKNVK
ncbi:hypothetical protein LG311_19065 [Sutcliffiella horikoshii]|uniref:hypothetical protein n=1 Tax=Sutcliffiella horikoshii TaxID=79883 RepID=UPI00384AC970